MELQDCRIRWETQSRNSAESMPVGGYDTGANVWVEKNQVFFYLQQSGWFDENNSLLKAGRFRIKIEPNPFEREFFQELLPEQGMVRIGGTGFEMRLWADVNRPVFHMEYESDQERSFQICYESWRTEDREVDSCSYELFQCKEMFFYPLENPVFHRDYVLPGEKKLFFYHQNKNQDLSINKEFTDQGLEEYLDQAYNPQKDLIFGGMLEGTELEFGGVSSGKYQDTEYRSYRYRTARPLQQGKAAVALAAVTAEDQKVLANRLEELLDHAIKNWEGDREQSRAWWKEYFEKSFITGNPRQEKWSEVMRNYQLFRYMMGCNYFSFWPTKFNGGLFTFDPSLGGKSPWSDDRLQYTPDYRLWGGGSHTIQNQRLLYWPMLKSGDFAAMKQHFDFFARTLETAKYRCAKSMGVKGAIYPEQVGTYGLCCGCDNEWGNRSGLPVAQIKYHFSNSLETVLMILEYYRFTGEDISEYMEFMESIVLFYDSFYQRDDENGKMIMYPANALETYHVVKNPIDGIAGLQAVVQRMLELPEELFSEKQKENFRRIQKRIPEIKTRVKEGHTILAYADTKSPIHNCEIPELYPVFPYGQFGLGKPDLELARDTARYAWQTEEQLTHISWHPTGIQYARLGMKQESEEFLFRKMGNGPFRFPAFWGPGHDWTPDHNWGGSGMIQLQEMLLQTEGRELRILPCWNRETDVYFRLHAPYHTTVECRYEDGRMTELTVLPKERRADVILPEWLGETEVET